MAWGKGTKGERGAAGRGKAATQAKGSDAATGGDATGRDARDGAAQAASMAAGAASAAADAAAGAARGAGRGIAAGLTALRDVRDAARQHSSAKSQMESMEKSLEAQRAALEHRESVEGSYDSIVATQAAALEAAQKSAAGAVQHAAHLARELQDLEARLAKMRADDEQALRPYRQLAESAKGRADDAARTVAEAKRGVRTAEGQVKDAMDRREQAIASANRTLDNSKARQRKVQGELDKLLADPSAKRDAIAQVRQELAVETSHVSAAEAAVTRSTADAQSSVDNTQTHLWTQKQSLESAQREAESMQAEAMERRGEYDHLRAEASARQKKLSDDIDGHKAEIERSNRLRDGARADAGRARDLIAEARSIHDTPQATEQLRHSIAERERALAAQRAQVEELDRSERELRRRTRATRLAVLAILAFVVVVVAALVASMLLG
ncbi:hypothetical protein [Tractidigestivibacter sp.]|uniref:hypothetical protein n=1 Tax=Tractidigestivibacter sp. TaxID=2847320 RepID=UPI002A90EDC7|nr:hypothetical protein [Tractidigestivibacter sp.]MDY5271029.1 hypothetical protein [Tractidigestivibacter sp.]